MGVVFFLCLWPLLAVAGLAYMLVALASVIILSPAFPFLLGALILNILAAADAIRLAWKWFYNGERFDVKASARRPLILVVVAFIAFWIGVVLAAAVIVGFFSGSAAANAVPALIGRAARPF